MHSPYSRRAFLGQATAGLGALALGGMKTERGLAACAAGDEGLLPGPATRGRAKSVIFLTLNGGVSSLDTFDYKPALDRLHGERVPSSIRAAWRHSPHAELFDGCPDKLMASPFSFTRHGQSGHWISELHPHLAQHVDELCFIHSLHAESALHTPASYQLHTGSTRAGGASLGARVASGLGCKANGLPGHVLLFKGPLFGGTGNHAAGSLPDAFRGRRFGAGEMAALDHEAGRLEEEPHSLCASYGLEHRDPRVAAFARTCLLARRLVERGVGFVHLADSSAGIGWDAHEDLTENHRAMARQIDQPIAALLSDLRQRGLLEETLVVCATEFGRTPMVQGRHGRGHNPAGFTAWLAGGGVQGGTRIGATDEIGLMAVEHPHSLRDLHATILAALEGDSADLSQAPAAGSLLSRSAPKTTIIPGVLG